MIKVIVADCTPTIPAVIKDAFPKTEFSIFPFSDGAALIAELESVQPHVILLNLFLESKDGYDVCRFLNHQESFKKIPIYLLKGAFDRIDEDRIRGLEYNDLIEEPFDSLALLKRVRDAVGEDFDPQTLPEEPAPTQNLSLYKELENKMKKLVEDQVRESEARLLAKLKIQNRTSLDEEA